MNHPGVYLSKKMKAKHISSNELSRKIGVPSNRVSDIVRGRRNITAKTAILLAGFFVETTPKEWLSKQSDYDLYLAEKEMNDA